MPTIRYKNEHKSPEGDDYIIYIDDTDYASTENSFTVTETGFNLTYEGDNGERIEPFIPSSGSFVMLIQNATDEAFITSLIGAEEGRFKVQVLKNTNFYWAGFILTDTILEADEYYPGAFEIRATDGIGRLKNIDYNNSGTAYTGRETLQAHIFNCFSKLDFDYFHKTDSFFEVVDEWFETQMTYAVGLNPLLVTDLDHVVFVSSEDNNPKYVSCYDVLRYICIMRRARLYFSDGTWRFEQPSARKNATFAEQKYNKSGAFISFSNTAYDKTIDQTLSGARTEGGVYDYFAPLDKVCLKYIHQNDKNLIDALEFSSAEVATTVTIGDVDVLFHNSFLKFEGNINLSVTWLNFAQAQMFRQVYKFTITATDANGWTRYLTRNIVIVGGNLVTYTDPYWSSNATYFEIGSNFFNAPTNPNLPTVEAQIDAGFTTPFIPGLTDVNPRTLTFRFEYIETRNFQNQIIFPGSLFTHTYILDDFNFQFLGDGSEVTANKAITYCVTNDLATSNTEIIELETIFGDGPLTGSFNKLKVSDGVDWFDSANWQVKATGTQYSLQELVITDTLGGQKIPVKKYQGTIYGSIDAQRKLIDGALEYLLLGGTFSTGQDRFTGVWYVIDTDYTNQTIEAEVILNELPVIGGGGGGPGGGNDEPVSPADLAIIDVLGVHETDEIIIGGFNEFIPIAPAEVGTFQEGDLITLINPTNGLYEEVTVKVDMLPGDTEILIYETLQFDYPPGTQVIPTASGNDPDYQLSSEIVTNFFESGATITDPDYYLETTAKVPTVYPEQVLDGGTLWTVTTPNNFFTVPPLYDGATMTTYIAAITAGTGSGNNTIDIKKNGSTEVTHNLAATIKTSTDTTEITLATGDEITTDITAITGTTAATGLVAYYIITPALNIELQKIKYTLNRVVRDDLILWHKLNRSALVKIGQGSIYFDETERINVGDDSTLDITGNISIMGWARFDEFSNSHTIFSKNNGTVGYMLKSKTGQIVFASDLTQTCAFNVSGNIVAYKWYNICATFDGTDARLYLDGTLMNTTAYSAPTTTTQDAQIGVYGDTFDPMQGSLAHVGIWNEALTNDQINSVRFKKYTDLTDAEKTDLVSWYTLDTIDGTTVEDVHGTNDGTVETI